jgi:hypothetical protein
MLFADLPVPVEIRNEARVHLWYAEHFGNPAPPFRDCADAIDHFAAVCCCYGVTVDAGGRLRVYAPHGYDDPFSPFVRPNRRLAPRHVYETKRGGRRSGPSSPSCPGTSRRGDRTARASAQSQQWFGEEDLGAVGAVGTPSAVGWSLDPEAVMDLGVVPLAQ